jgi:hypothetical protein
MAVSGLFTVSNAGVRFSDGQTQTIVLLRSPVFPSGQRNFTSAPNMSRELLAVALAAITSDRLVYCLIADDTEWNEITQINLMSGK